jgi:hypothetical protein
VREQPGDLGRADCATATRWRALRAPGRHVKPATAGASCCWRSSRRPSKHTWCKPTFITHYPVEVSPLARANRQRARHHRPLRVVHRRQGAGQRLLRAQRPEDQAARFRAQVEAKEGGDDEAMHFDADYIRALEVRHAADRRPGHRHRPAGDAAHRVGPRSATCCCSRTCARSMQRADGDGWPAAPVGRVVTFGIGV